MTTFAAAPPYFPKDGLMGLDLDALTKQLNLFCAHSHIVTESADALLAIAVPGSAACHWLVDYVAAWEAADDYETRRVASLAIHEYAFDVKLFSTIRVKAGSEADARQLLAKHVDCASANFGMWPNGDPILGEASVDDDAPDLIEIDGEAV